MPKDTPISRRQSLKRIATTGAVIGGVGLGTNTVSGSHKNLEQVYLDYYDYDPCTKKAEFRVCNNARKTLSFHYKVEGTGEKGKITVKSDGNTEYGYFKVDASKGDVTVRLYYGKKRRKKKGKKDKKDKVLVDTAQSDIANPRSQHLGADDVSLEAIAPKKQKDGKYRATFKATNHTNDRIHTKIEYSGDSEPLCIDANDSQTFSVPFPKKWPKKSLEVTIQYNDHSVSAEWYRVWNLTSGKGYDSLEDALDDADKSDKILVFGWGAYGKPKKEKAKRKHKSKYVTYVDMKKQYNKK